MATKTSSIIGLVFGLAIIFMGIMAVVSGEPSAKGAFLYLPMAFGLFLIIVNIIALVKKPAQPPVPQTQPLQPVQPSQPAPQTPSVQAPSTQEPIEITK